MKVQIEDNQIVIRVPIDALPTALELGPLGHDFAVTDAAKFAAAVAKELEHENHDVPVLHTLFDEAMERAIEGACEGVVERECQEDR